MALDVNAAMDSIGTALTAISGLRVYDYIADSVAVPAAVVAFPDEFEYDHTLVRGTDRATFQVTVLVGKSSDRASRDALGAYLSGVGASSVKLALDAIGRHVRTMRARTAITTIGQQDYLSATFDVDWVQ
jgi:hypothetical protein